jgi:hypothetical protein
MKRLLSVILMSLLLAVTAVYAEQPDINSGFLKLATATVTISPGAVTDLLFTEPSSSTTWLAANPGGQWILLPSRCRGFQINAFGGDMIIGHPEQIATGTIYVGVKIASGTSMKWENLSPDQSVIKFRIYMNGTAGTATLAAWGQ